MIDKNYVELINGKSAAELFFTLKRIDKNKNPEYYDYVKE